MDAEISNALKREILLTCSKYIFNLYFVRIIGCNDNTERTNYHGNGIIISNTSVNKQ